MSSRKKTETNQNVSGNKSICRKTAFKNQN